MANGLGCARSLGLAAFRSAKSFSPLPKRLESKPAQGVVAVLRAGMAFRQVGGVRGDLVGDDAVFHVFLVRQAEVFLGRDA